VADGVWVEVRVAVKVVVGVLVGVVVFVGVGVKVGVEPPPPPLQVHPLGFTATQKLLLANPWPPPCRISKPVSTAFNCQAVLMYPRDTASLMNALMSILETESVLFTLA